MRPGALSHAPGGDARFHEVIHLDSHHWLEFQSVIRRRVLPCFEFPHFPAERMKLDSVGRFYDLLTETLKELAG